MTHAPFWSLDATGQAEAVRIGAITPRAALDQTFARIDALNPQINAIVTQWRARAYDRLAQIDPAAPFAFVPMLLKETTPYAGARTTFGSRWLADYQASASAPIAQAFEALGFVIVGYGNAPEFGLSDVTEPALFGPTRNPWDVARSPGGSSGGAAAAVSAGLVAVAHGSDGGGSLRAPASHCGLFTLKPSRGWPSPPLSLPGAEWLPGLVSQFALTRSVRDAIGLRAGLSAAMAAPELPAARPRPEKMRIAAIATPLHGGALAPEVAQAFDAACGFLRDAGHETLAIDWPFDGAQLHTAFFDAWAGLARGYVGYLSSAFSRPINPDLLEPWTRGLLAMAERQSPADQAVIAFVLTKAAQTYDGLFDRYDLLITPIYAKPPPMIDAHNPMQSFDDSFAKIAGGVAFTPLQNIAGAPAVVTPFATSGLPIGLHIAGRRGDDAFLLDFAARLEALRPWRRFAPLAESIIP